MGCQHKIEGALKLIVREIRRRLINGLNRLTEQQHIAAMGINALSQALEERMGFWQPFATGSFCFEQKRNGVEAKAIHPPLQPEIDDVQHRLLDPGIFVVEIRLMTEKAMQVVLLRNGIPFPVR